MPRVANYELFRDLPFSLRRGGDIDRTLEANIGNTPADGEGAIAMWRVNRQGSGSVSYRVLVNGTQFYVNTVNDANRTTVHEAIRTPNISRGTNRIRFEVTGGTGTLQVADVIIWYRQDV